MKRGTKSLLFGAHQFLLHPLFVLLAWRKLFGFPWDPRVWVCIFVHDLGYLGKAQMDSEEGERHVLWGSWVAGALFGQKFHDLCLGHSRHYAKSAGIKVSRLCYADKLAFCLTPRWLYLRMARASGELAEYRKTSDKAGFVSFDRGERKWFEWTKAHCKMFVMTSCRTEAAAESVNEGSR